MTRSRELAELASAYDGGGSLSFRNRIINGDMRIDQRNAGASVTPSSASYYTVDRFIGVGTQASKLTWQQVSDAPAGFTNSLRISVASAATPSASDQFRFGQLIEGFNVADLGWGTANAQSVTISFRAKASVAGTYSVALLNGFNGRSYVTTVSLTTSWASYSFTVPGDTSGTWATGNTTGIEIQFDLGGGSNWTTSTTNAWQGSNFFKASGSVSFVSNAAATLNITGVQLEAGSVATPFERRPYGTELALCQRYFYRTTNSNLTGAWGVFYSTTAGRVWKPFPVSMRVAPTCTFSSLNFDRVGTGTVTASSVTGAFIDNETVSFDGIGFPASTFANPLAYIGTISASAEL